MANESSFEALYNGHQFSYVSIISMYRKYPNEAAGISKTKINDFYLRNKMNHFTLSAVKSKRIEVQRSANGRQFLYVFLNNLAIM